MIKPHLTCHICIHDKVLNGLKTTLRDIQAELRMDWRSSTIVKLQDHLFPGQKVSWFLTNSKGQATVIPSYGLYDQTWRKALYLNPFTVDWMLFDVHDRGDVEYIQSLVGVLQDQQDLWNFDSDTKGQSITVLFDRFVKAVKRMLMHSLNATY